MDALAFDENPVEYLLNKFPEAGLKPEGMRAMLGRFGLSGHHHLTPIVKLSGEEEMAGGAVLKHAAAARGVLCLCLYVVAAADRRVVDQVRLGAMW